MFKRILVAAHLARAGEGSLLLLHAVNTSSDSGMDATGMGAAVFLQEALDKELIRATTYLAGVAHSLGVEEIETRIATYAGRAAPYILKVAREQNHSLKEQMTHEVHALVALDGSPFSEAALLPAADLAAALSAPEKGSLHLVQLVQVPTVEEEFGEMPDADFTFRQTALETAGNYLQSVRAKLLREHSLSANMQITWSVEEGTDVAGVLIQITESGKGLGTRQV